MQDLSLDKMRSILSDAEGGGSAQGYSDTENDLQRMSSILADAKLPEQNTPQESQDTLGYLKDTAGTALESMAGAVGNAPQAAGDVLGGAEGLVKGAAAFTLGTPIAAGLGAAYAVSQGDINAYSGMFDHINSAIGKAFEADTESGKAVQDTIGGLFSKAEEISGALADANYEATGNAAWGTAVRGMGEGLIFAIPYIGAKGIGKAAKPIIDRVKFRNTTQTAKDLGTKFPEKSYSEVDPTTEPVAPRGQAIPSYLPTEQGLSKLDFRIEVKRNDAGLNVKNVDNMWEEYKNPAVIKAYQEGGVTVHTPQEFLTHLAGNIIHPTRGLIPSGWKMTPVTRAKYLSYVNGLLPDNLKVKTYNAAVNRAMDLRAQEVAGHVFKKVKAPINKKVVEQDTDPEAPLADEVARVSKEHTEEVTGKKLKPLEEKEPNISSEKRPLLESAGEIVAGQSISLIRKLGERAPTAKKLADMIFRPERGTGNSAGDISFHQARQIKGGDYMQKFTDILDAAKGAWFPGIKKLAGREGLSKAVESGVVKYLRGIRTGEESSGVIKTADAIRSLMDNIRKYVSKSIGEPIENLPNFFPRMYKLKEGLREDWNELLAKHDISAFEADAIFDHILENKGRISPISIALNVRKGHITTKASSLDYARKLRMIPDSELAPFLNNNLYDVISRYIEDSVSRAEFAKRFGSNLEKVDAMVKQIAKEAQASGEPIKMYEINRIYDELDAWQGIYKHSEISRAQKAIQKGIITASNMSLLQLAALSSIQEVILPISEVGVIPWAKAMPHALSALTRTMARNIYKGIPKNQVEELAESIRKAGGHASMERMNALLAGDHTAISDLSFRLNTLYYLTEFTNYIAIASYDSLWKGYFKALAKGKGDKWLALRGYNKAEIDQMAEYYNINLNDAVGWLNGGKQKGSAFYRNYKAGALTFAEDVVLTPNPATVPMFHSDARFALIRHLKTFPTLMGNQIMKRWFTGLLKTKPGYGSKVNYLRKVAPTIFGTIVVADMANKLRDYWVYGGRNPVYDPDDQATRLARAIDRVGFLGPGTNIWDAVTNPRVSIIDTIVGADISLMSKAVSGLSSVITGTNARPLARQMAKLTPIAGLTKKSRTATTDNYEKALNIVLPWTSKHSPRSRKVRK